MHRKKSRASQAYLTGVMPVPDKIPNTGIMLAATVAPVNSDMAPAEAYAACAAFHSEFIFTCQVLSGETSFAVETPVAGVVVTLS